MSYVPITPRTQLQIAKPTTGEFKNYVAKKLRAHVRFATDVRGRRPAASAITHLVDYVVRTALRERWDVTDVARYSDRLERMMFAGPSELVEMTNLSGFTFVEDATFGDEETVLSSTEIAFVVPPVSNVAAQHPDLPVYAAQLKQSYSSMTSQYSRHVSITVVIVIQL